MENRYTEANTLRKVEGGRNGTCIPKNDISKVSRIHNAIGLKILDDVLLF